MRSAKHGGAALAAAFSETVMTSAPGSLAQAYGSLPSAAGSQTDGGKSSTASHHASSFYRADGSRKAQFGDDPLRALRHALFTVRRAEQTRHDASAVTLSMQSHKLFGAPRVPGSLSGTAGRYARSESPGYHGPFPRVHELGGPVEPRERTASARYSTTTASGWRSSGKPSTPPRARRLNERRARRRRASGVFFDSKEIRDDDRYRMLRNRDIRTTVYHLRTFTAAFSSSTLSPPPARRRAW